MASNEAKRENMPEIVAQQHQLTMAWPAYGGQAGEGTIGCCCGRWRTPWLPQSSAAANMEHAKKLLQREHVMPMRYQAALAELVAVCDGMDHPDQDQRPEEELYLATLKRAHEVLLEGERYGSSRLRGPGAAQRLVHQADG